MTREINRPCVLELSFNRLKGYKRKKAILGCLSADSCIFLAQKQIFSEIIRCSLPFKHQVKNPFSCFYKIFSLTVSK